MKKLIILFLAIFILGTVSVSAEGKIVSKDKDWNTYTDETIGLSIDLPKYLNSNLLGNNDPWRSTIFLEQTMYPIFRPIITVNIHIHTPVEYLPPSLNDCTDEEIISLKNHLQKFFSDLLKNPNSVESTDIKTNGQRAIMFTTQITINDQLVDMKILYIIFNKQLVGIAITSFPENKEAVKTVEQIQNSIRFSK